MGGSALLRAAAAALALVLIGFALARLAGSSAGVAVERIRLGPTPVTVYRPAEAGPGPRPLVVISHGFAGSQQLMQPFAFTLARNGYTAVTFDYLGHGRNRHALGGDVNDVEGSTELLLEQTGRVVDYALALPDTGAEVAMLGHSMASDVVVRYARRDERVHATIAVSLFSPAVTADAPDNLLVIVGELEGYLRQEAMRVLSMVAEDPAPGVTYGSFREGTARRAVFADGVEHVAVLYSPQSLRESVAWLQQAMMAVEGPAVAPAPAGERSAAISVAHRGVPILLLLAGIGLLGWPLACLLPRLSTPAQGASLGWHQLLPAALVPAVATPLLLWWFPADFLSVLVGGYLAVHFGVYGLVTAACLWWLRRHHQHSSRGDITPPAAAAITAAEGTADGAGAPPSGSWPARLMWGIAATVAATAYVAGAMALALDAYVTSFAITPPRVPLVFAMLAGTLSYFVADEWLTRGTRTPRGAHAFTRVCFLLSLGLAVALSFQELFFLLIIAVIILLYFIVYGLFSSWIYRATGHPAIGAIANAVAFAWALAVVFPMLTG